MSQTSPSGPVLGGAVGAAPRGALGLDVGTSRIVAARRSGAEYSYESQLNAFVSIPYSKTHGVGRPAPRERPAHGGWSQQILVQGNESEKFAAPPECRDPPAP